MMNITFQKQSGASSLDIVFFWKMELETTGSVFIQDYFIPELFFDYFYIQKGKVKYFDKARGLQHALPRQSLKTIHNHTLNLVLQTPLVLLGVRLSLKFAESFWETMRTNPFLEQKWIRENTNDLESFASQITDFIQRYRKRNLPYPMLLSTLEESSWLANFSPRHKRRLYKATFGLSRQEIQNIHNLHSFLEQTCDFDSQNPRIIQHMNPEVFYDQPHFNHTFKKMTGFSPVEYFQSNSIIQDTLMSASYNENSREAGKL